MEVFPGLDGIPFRQPKGAAVPFFREDDPPHLKPQLVHDAHVRIFDLNKPEELKEYAGIMQGIARGKYIFSAEERLPQGKAWKIFLRWWEPFYEAPPAMKAGGHR